jgi:hypothetical protein
VICIEVVEGIPVDETELVVGVIYVVVVAFSEDTGIDSVLV